MSRIKAIGLTIGHPNQTAFGLKNVEIQVNDILRSGDIPANPTNTLDVLVDGTGEAMETTTFHMAENQTEGSVIRLETSMRGEQNIKAKLEKSADGYAVSVEGPSGSRGELKVNKDSGEIEVWAEGEHKLTIGTTGQISDVG